MLLPSAKLPKTLPFSTPQVCENFARALVQSDFVIDVSEDRNAVHQYLVHLVELALDKTYPSCILYDSYGLKYELRRDDDNIYVTKTDYVTVYSLSTWSFDTFFFDAREEKKDLCTLPIKKLLDVALSISEGRNAQMADGAMFSLVGRNNLSKLICDRAGSKAEHRTILKNQRFLTWRRENVAVKNSDHSPCFRYRYDGAEILSKELTNFLRNGTMPNGDSEKTLLLWGCWQIMGTHIQRHGPKCCGYLQFIVDRIVHLDFTVVKFQPNPDDYGKFAALLAFLEYRFAGDAISFNKMVDNDSGVESIMRILDVNPNVTCLHMAACDLASPLMLDLAIFIQANRTLTELHLDGCSRVGIFLRYLEKNYFLKVLSIKNTEIDEFFGKTLALLPSITSINIEGNQSVWSDRLQDELVNLLGKNAMLVSFKTNNFTSKERLKKCAQYMNRNLFNRHRASYINFYEFLNADLPERMEGILPDGLPQDVKSTILGMLYFLNHRSQL